MVKKNKINLMEEQLQELDAKRAVLIEKIKECKTKETKQEKKSHKKALHILGEMVENACGGDWRAIDYESLDNLLQKYAGSYRKLATEKGRPAKDAISELLSSKQKMD